MQNNSSSSGSSGSSSSPGSSLGLAGMSNQSLVEHLAVFRRAAFEPSMIDSMTSNDMDKICTLVTKIFHDCSQAKASSTADDDYEQRIQEQRLMPTVLTVRNNFHVKAKDSSRHGALYVLFHKTISTPTNLRNLLRMCNPKIRTGTVRCHALVLLHVLAEEDYATYRIPIEDDDDDDSDNNNRDKAATATTTGTTTTVFIKKLISIMAHAVSFKNVNCMPNDSDDDDRPCPCTTTPWKCFRLSLAAAQGGMFSDLELLQLLVSHDWVKVLCSDECNRFSEWDLSQEARVKGSGVYHNDVLMFHSLHGCAVHVLKKYPNNDTMAKHFLRNQLSACHELLRRCMRRIITGDIYATPSHERKRASNSNDFQRQLLAEIKVTIKFLIDFPRCLALVPVDRETMSLIRRARAALAEPFGRNIDRFELDEALIGLFRWQQFHRRTEEERWTQFQQDFLKSQDRRVTKKSLRKEFKQFRQDEICERANVQGGEICANCFVLEKELIDEESGHRLSLCANCKCISYCSRECQVEHWKKAHQATCMGKKNNHAVPRLFLLLALGLRFDVPGQLALNLTGTVVCLFSRGSFGFWGNIYTW